MNQLLSAKRHIHNACTLLRLDNYDAQILWELANALDLIDEAINDQRRMPHVSEIPLAIPAANWRRFIPRMFRRIA